MEQPSLQQYRSYCHIGNVRQSVVPTCISRYHASEDPKISKSEVMFYITSIYLTQPYFPLFHVIMPT